jgi:DNA-binding transcriptional ArsR family regulator
LGSEGSVLHVHFTGEDLARVRVGAPWGPLAETMFSVATLSGRRPNVLIDGWREAVVDSLGERARPLLAVLHPFAELDVLTLVGESPSIDEGLERLLGVRDDHLRLELEELWDRASGPPSARPWMRDLLRGDFQARRQLVTHIRAYYGSALGPYWEGVRSHLEVDRAIRGRIMADGGVDGLLATLHPNVRWRPPVLEVVRPAAPGARPDVDREVHLAGRSMILVPSVFCAHPMLCLSTADETLPELLIYPALRELDDALGLWGNGSSGRLALQALLGRTRALALEATIDPCTTGELARRIGVSAATASHHASVLRQARLINTRRNGSAVLHSITARGAILLDAPRHAGPSSALRSA